MGWRVLAGLVIVVVYLGVSLALARRRYALEDASEDGAEDFRGSFGGDQGASDE
jgi:hypothetical protein